MMMQRKIALITGGHGDLARAISTRFERAGWSVLSPGREELDVSSSDSVKNYFQEAERVDLLINNAGITRDQLLSRMSAETWDKVLAVNLKGAFLTSQQALKGMVRRRNGHIVNIGSFSAIRAPFGQANYVAAKSGMIGMTQSLAAEVGKRNVRVNCVLPGFLETKMTQELSEAATANALEQHVLDRFNTTEDVASFLECLQGLCAVSGTSLST